jgi:hypothetical protein
MEQAEQEFSATVVIVCLALALLVLIIWRH